MTTPNIPTGIAGAEVIASEAFASLAHAFVYANHPDTTSGLVRGYYGGRWGSFNTSDSTHTFGASTTTYVSVNRASGALNFSTSNTNYNDSTNYARVETVVTDGTGVTALTDDRGGPGGVHGGGSGGGGSSGLPVNSQSSAYTLVLGDANGCIYHPSSDTTARTWTIPANSSVAFPIGTTITFDNDDGAGALTIAITTDTLVLVGSAGGTGSRTLAEGGRAVALKVTSTRWRISGTAELT